MTLALVLSVSLLAAPEAVASAGTADDAAPAAIVRVGALPFVEVLRRQVGAEVQAFKSLGERFDVGLGLTIGSNLGLRALVDAHFDRRDLGFAPFVELRVALHPSPFGFGLGGLAGGSFELGPGRLKLGAALEGYLVAAPGYAPLALLVVGGYELDLLRPAPTVVVVREVVRPEPASTGVLKGRVLDLDERPLEGAVAVPARGSRADAAPSFELVLPAGTWHVEASAPGYLSRGRRMDLKAGETLVFDFLLRPAPVTKTAELTKERIAIKQMVQFEFNKARILPESFFILDEVVDLMLHNPDVGRVRVEGHTDDVGTEAVNLTLSRARAYAVVEYLIDHGVAAQRLEGRGYGATRPLEHATTDEARAKNRRVQFELEGK